jgi:hypothetical protein
MRTIKLEITVSQSEYDLLVAAKMDQPHPDKIRYILLSDAARVLKHMSDAVLSNLRDQQMCDAPAVRTLHQRLGRQ